MSFKYESKSVFLTYSQCPAAPEALLALLKERTGTRAGCQLLKACIGQEKHADGGLHLHAVAWYTQKLTFRKVDYLDLDGHHPNIKGNRVFSAVKALDYVTKECPEPVCYNLDLAAEKAARKDKKKILTKRILDGDPLAALVEEGEINLIDLPKWKAGLECYKRIKGEEKPDLPETLTNPWGLSLLSDCGKDVKKRHYWIWSREPNRGKTRHFLKPLADNHRARFYNKKEKYQAFPRDTQAVLIDEYTHAEMYTTQLNEMCDGNYTYPVKGDVGMTLNDPLIIICSNKPISEVYPKTCKFLYARFNEFNVDEKAERHPGPILAIKPRVAIGTT
jgi:hypothetical protein